MHADRLDELRERLQAALKAADDADDMAVKADRADQPLIALARYEQAHSQYRVATKIAEGVLADWPGRAS